MPNKPRPENPHRSVRVEDDLWRAAGEAAEDNGTTRAAIIQQALRDYVASNTKAGSNTPSTTTERGPT